MTAYLRSPPGTACMYVCMYDGASGNTWQSRGSPTPGVRRPVSVRNSAPFLLYFFVWYYAVLLCFECNPHQWKVPDSTMTHARMYSPLFWKDQGFSLSFCLSKYGVTFFQLLVLSLCGVLFLFFFWFRTSVVGDIIIKKLKQQIHTKTSPCAVETKDRESEKMRPTCQISAASSAHGWQATSIFPFFAMPTPTHVRPLLRVRRTKTGERGAKEGQSGELVSSVVCDRQPQLMCVCVCVSCVVRSHY